MRIATVNYHGSARYGVVSGSPHEPLIELFSGGTGLLSAIGEQNFATATREAPFPLRSMPSLPPIPNPGKILCLAGNYREHIVESGFAAPETEDVITQQVFLKPSTCLIGSGTEIPIGPENVAVGWEVELAVVIGRGGRNIPASDALNHVFGYTILNDISERKLNSRLANRKKREFDAFFDWLAGKWFDGFAPCGPWIVTADEIPNPHDLGIRLWVNGELRQESNTGAMIFDIPAQIEYASSITRLEPGDILSTGTPAGAGLGSGSKILQDGDELVCEIDRIGTLRNRVKAAA
jgi:2-keto-4-pentenoate hydratase/2-oxohepta-3-ene-1,7-dioic acid hydratase in catechol pathway